MEPNLIQDYPDVDSVHDDHDADDNEDDGDDDDYAHTGCCSSPDANQLV